MKIFFKKFKEKRIITALIALTAALCVLLSSCAPDEVGVKTLSSVVSRNVISFRGEDSSSLHYAESRDSYSETVVTSGLIELKLDRDTNSFAIHDTSSGMLWTSLPLLEDAGSIVDENCPSSLVTLRISGGSDIYVLNSQDNALAYGTAFVNVNEKGAVFTYEIYADEAAAKKETPGKNDIGFRVKLDVSLADGNMTVTCKYDNITGNKDAVIEDIEVLNFFGAYNDTGEKNFLFVPDGCGAIIKTSVFDESFESLSFPVYGTDLSAPGEASGSAVIASFGVRRGNSAFAALAEKGDAAATVKAEKAMDLKSYNRAYSSYRVTPTEYDGSTLYISKTPCIDEIKLCYRFLSANNATYSGMASAVREQLIRNGVLSAKANNSSDYLPFFLTLTGAVAKKFSKISYAKSLTDFDQAYDMLVRMKNKGINNVNIRYNNVFTGAANQKDISKARIMHCLGGDSALEKLCSYTETQNMTLFLNIDILSAASGLKETAGSITGKSGTYTPAGDVDKKAGSAPAERVLRKITDLKTVVISALKYSRERPFDGYCIGDAGSVLYSDFSNKGALRQESSEFIASTISPLSTGNKIMVGTGNIYMLKNADSVINLPLTAGVPKSGAYQPIPFIQLILHGFADYAGEPVNTSVNEEEAMLRCIEYGACPHYIWNYTALSANSDSDSYFYDNSINSAADFYAEANEALSDLRQARITDHREVQDGIFRTEYDSGAIIYVNYTDSEFPVLGTSLGARSFLRVN